MVRSFGRHSVIATLIEAPWWMTALLGTACYFTVRVIIPGVFEFLVIVGVLEAGGTSVADICRLLARGVVATFAGLAALSRRHANEKRQHEEQLNRMAAMRKRPSAAKSPFAATIATVPPGGAAKAKTLAPAVQRARTREWSLDALKQLEWKRFEQLCVAYYEALDFKVKTVALGPDGGIDATLYKRGQRTPLALVQCKAWQRPVKVEQVRALAGVMLERQVRRGVFWSLSGYVGQPVQESAARAGIQLLDGEAIVARIRALPPEKQAALLALAFEGDYRTPTCAACGVKLVPRHSKAGPFWGCLNFPRCRMILPRAA